MTLIISDEDLKAAYACTWMCFWGDGNPFPSSSPGDEIVPSDRSLDHRTILHVDFGANRILNTLPSLSRVSTSLVLQMYSVLNKHTHNRTGGRVFSKSSTSNRAFSPGDAIIPLSSSTSSWKLTSSLCRLSPTPTSLNRPVSTLTTIRLSCCSQHRCLGGFQS